MRKALIAGVAYFAIVFALAFAVGVVRVLVVAPRLGETGAVLLELPIILAASWLACGYLLKRFAFGQRLVERLVMGLTAFIVLQGAEFLLAITAFARSPDDYLAAVVTTAGLLGLAGQIGFALIPLVRRRG